MRWNLTYYHKIPRNARGVELEAADLGGKSIHLAHDRVREVSDGLGVLVAARVIPTAPPVEGVDPLSGTPTRPMWITYVPYVPCDDEDETEIDRSLRQRQRFDFPEKLWDIWINPKGEEIADGPSTPYAVLAVERFLGDGRRAYIERFDYSE
ncbi:hypothetical protein [Streptomyces albipurpureus]|uniref:Uncharacterized protein n=1 Tax=Streptomyces albipurpureus TaxID=2897419 RepID=A0ABT0UP18_9ACTN|nr:hypothetical protein [Streptomyces sp. CWNU-1]MCM2390209.1 hypothetical protein [Streptomyces sp. CWNU-1]